MQQSCSTSTIPATQKKYLHHQQQAAAGGATPLVAAPSPAAAAVALRSAAVSQPAAFVRAQAAAALLTVRQRYGTAAAVHQRYEYASMRHQGVLDNPCKTWNGSAISGVENTGSRRLSKQVAEGTHWPRRAIPVPHGNGRLHHPLTSSTWLAIHILDPASAPLPLGPVRPPSSLTPCLPCCNSKFEFGSNRCPRSSASTRASARRAG